MREFYKQFMGSDDLVFDIGANVGNRTGVFLELARMVIAAEPQGDCSNTLYEKFGSNPKFRIVTKAIGATEGLSQIQLCGTISSLSPGWMTAVERSGRFAGHRWSTPMPVHLTTLDRLIAEYGTPAFIKIDVEGYELEVLTGLSVPVEALSFEFTPEYIESGAACIQRLESIGMRRFNYSLGESLKLELADWASGGEVEQRLRQYHDIITFGDVYASA